MSDRRPSPLTEAHPKPILMWLAYGLLLGALLFLVGWWAVVKTWIPVPYEVDHGNSIVCVLLLLCSGFYLLWQTQQQQREHEQKSHQRWLSLLMVRREQIESALLQLEDVQSALSESLQAMRSSISHQQMPPQEELALISPSLQPCISSLAAISGDLLALKERLVNVHVKFSQGVALDALVYDLSHLAQSCLQLEDRVKIQLADLSAVESKRSSQWQSLLQAPTQDPLAPWRDALQSMETAIQQARELLSQGLGMAAPDSPPSLDQFLGINR